MAQHGIVYARSRRAFARGHWSRRNIAIGDHTNRFQVLDAFDYSNLTAVMPDHHLGCLPHRALRRAVSKVGDHNVLAFNEMAKCC